MSVVFDHCIPRTETAWNAVGALELGAEQMGFLSPAPWECECVFALQTSVYPGSVRPPWGSPREDILALRFTRFDEHPLSRRWAF